jgi:hypothetical protein
MVCAPDPAAAVPCNAVCGAVAFFGGWAGMFRRWLPSEACGDRIGLGAVLGRAPIGQCSLSGELLACCCEAKEPMMTQSSVRRAQFRPAAIVTRLQRSMRSDIWAPYFRRCFRAQPRAASTFGDSH